MKKLNIAIIGLGNIGSYLYKFLKKNKEILSKKNNCIPNNIYISAKNRKRNRGFKINNKIIAYFTNKIFNRFGMD